MENLIEIRGLSKCYHDFALENVDLTVPAGCIVGLIGENGAGKTTTLKAILNIVHPDSGEIRLMGKDPSDPESRLQVGTVFEDSYFHDCLNITKISRIMGKICVNWDEKMFLNYCRRFRLSEEKTVGEFSRGMRMKLSLATALSRHPRLLILDEATSGLDPVVRRQILDLFLEFIQDESCSILMSSHITDDMEKVCDQIAYLHNGRMIFQENKDELLESMAILQCSKNNMDRLPADLVISRSDGAFGSAALIRRRTELRRLFPDAVLEKPSLEDIMRFYSGGISK